MPTYTYKARKRTGETLQEDITAASKQEVLQHLKQLDCIPIRIDEASSSVVSGGGWRWFSAKVSASDLNFFTRQLYTMQKAGLPLLSGLGAIAKQTDNAAFKAVIDSIGRDVEEGKELSAALARHPRVFNDLYVNMIKAGEASGKLVEILERLTLLREYEQKVQRQVKSALRYPTFVLVGITIAFFLLIMIVIPRFEHIYAQYKSALPIYTRILIGLNRLIGHYWWIWVPGLIGGVFGLRHFVRTPTGRQLRDRTLLHIPILGPLMLRIMMSRFCRISGILMSSGVPLLKILELVSGSIDNRVVADVIQRIRQSVHDGQGMQQPMADSRLFPPIVIQMVAVGEQTGKLDDLLFHVADYYEREVDYTISNLVALIEPILILVLGLGVLLMALGTLMPMWNIMRLFRR